MTEFASVDASPLIYLSKSGLLQIVELAARRLFLPRAVLDELRAKENSDGCLSQVLALPSLVVLESVAIPDVIAGWDLGRGESSVLAIAYERPGCVAIIDDLAARRCAETLGVPLRGTIGLVLRARREGLITSAADTLRILRSHGMYLSDRIVRQVLALVGESFDQ